MRHLRSLKFVKFSRNTAASLFVCCNCLLLRIQYSEIS
jgi:hypothetical protein